MTIFILKLSYLCLQCICFLNVDILYFVVGIKAHEGLCYLLMYLNLTLSKDYLLTLLL